MGSAELENWQLEDWRDNDMTFDELGRFVDALCSELIRYRNGSEEARLRRDADMANDALRMESIAHKATKERLKNAEQELALYNALGLDKANPWPTLVTWNE